MDAGGLSQACLKRKSAVRDHHPLAQEEAEVFSYDHLEFRYEPFPIGVAKPALAGDIYRELVDSYPPQELFAYLPKVGHKYSLSEKYNGQAYAKFIKSSAPWRELHAWIKSDAFVPAVMAALKAHHIDLGQKPLSGAKRTFKAVKNLARGRRRPLPPQLSTRFEFSMLPANGGYIMPHTDSPSKIVTLIVSMSGEDEWNPAFGGGTDVNRPKDVRLAFNRMNAQADFDEMDVLDTFEFTPNQVVVFVKTFNSWHSVRPMTGAGSPLMRKTLTINIEAAA
jgi:hypothetical protein